MNYREWITFLKEIYLNKVTSMVWGGGAVAGKGMGEMFLRTAH